MLAKCCGVCLYAGVGNAGLQELSSLTSLTSLNLDSRLFTDVGMRHIQGLTNLVALDLFAARISDIGCGYFRCSLLLCHLALQHCYVTVL